MSAITPLPDPPTRQDPANFNERADEFLSALESPFVPELNAFRTEMLGIGDLAEDAVTAAATATAAADAAQFTADALMWNAATAYVLGENAISPTNFKTYRRKVAGTSATDPSADATNWVLVFDAYTKEESDAKFGKVLQVVHASTTTEVAIASNIFTDTTLTATITPTSATSKILVLITQSYYRIGATSAVDIKLFRGATDLGLIAVYMGYGATSTCVDSGVAASQTLDTPITISPVTYKTQFRNVVATNSVRVQYNNTPSTITLMEIAA